MPPASQIFELFELHESQSVCCHEVFSASFGVLRRSLRGIVVRLAESDEQVALELSDRFRSRLSEWLTVPIQFDDGILEALRAIGDSGAIQSRWGADIRALFDTAMAAAHIVAAEENPLRVCLRSVLRELRTSGKSFKIYCHRSAVPHFQSLLPDGETAPFSAEDFLHTVRDYRESGTFESLVKVGPLRARGWGSAPDAVRSAPRFLTLLQFVWSGCSDEPGFGYDPASTPPPPAETLQTAPAQGGTALSHRISWNPQVIQFGFDAALVGASQIDEDDFQILAPLTRSSAGKRAATLIHVDDGQGMLFPPLARVISFDPKVESWESICYRLPGESLLEGMYLVRPLVGDVDLGGMRAEHGHYSRIWKTRLQQEFQADAAGLEARLRASGLDLVHLGAAINHWCAHPTTVIHAPQQMRHFEILVSALGCGVGMPNIAGVPWWRLAWNEIRRTRGEASQAGMQEHEIVEEQMIAVLRELLPQIRPKASADAGFNLEIPSGSAMQGAFLFFKISGVEEGFLAPEAELKIVRELNTLEQWRV